MKRVLIIILILVSVKGYSQDTKDILKLIEYDLELQKQWSMTGMILTASGGLLAIIAVGGITANNTVFGLDMIDEKMHGLYNTISYSTLMSSIGIFTIGFFIWFFADKALFKTQKEYIDYINILNKY